MAEAGAIWISADGPLSASKLGIFTTGSERSGESQVAGDNTGGQGSPMITRVALYEASILRSIGSHRFMVRSRKLKTNRENSARLFSSPNPKRPGPNLINCGGHSSATKGSQYPGIIWGKFEDFTAQAHAYTEPIKPFKRAICP